MAIRILYALTDGQLDKTKWDGQVKAALPVGRCDICKTDAYGDRLVRTKGRLSATAYCTGRRHEASILVPRPAAAAVPSGRAGRETARRTLRRAVAS